MWDGTFYVEHQEAPHLVRVHVEGDQLVPEGVTPLEE